MSKIFLLKKQYQHIVYQGILCEFTDIRKLLDAKDMHLVGTYYINPLERVAVFEREYYEEVKDA